MMICLSVGWQLIDNRRVFNQLAVRFVGFIIVVAVRLWLWDLDEIAP
jgi:hypothetical protein